MENTPKLVKDIVFDNFREFANKSMKEVAEPGAFVLVVDWLTGSNDFPAGLVLTKNNEVDLDQLIRLQKALLKVSMQITTIVQKLAKKQTTQGG